MLHFEHDIRYNRHVMRLQLLRLGMLLFMTTALMHAETVTLRSGNGALRGRDSLITFLLGPPAGDFSQPLTASDFSNAQDGGPAYIIPFYGLWITGLTEDPLARWIGTNSTADESGNTALCAISFQISDAFNSANLTLHYAADDTPSLLSGFLLNGTVICQNEVASGFSQEHTLTCDIGSLLQVGTNWLYFDIVNTAAGTGAGLLFSATITTTSETIPSINSGGVVNAASYAAPVVPGSIAAAFGTFLLTSPLGATTNPLPTNLAGLSLQFGGGVPAPLFFASGGQVNLQVPWELNGPSQTTLTATLNNLSGTAQTVNLAPFAPAIFSQNSEGSGQGAILDTSYRLVDGSNPATPGVTYILIYCTGLGQVSNQPQSGAPAPDRPLAETAMTPTVSIGSVPANVSFSGLAPGYVGLYQVNAQVPAGAPAGSAVPVVVSIGGVTSNTVTIAVQ